MLIEFFIQPRFLVRFIRVVIVVFKTITLAKIHFSVGGAKSVGAKYGGKSMWAADRHGVCPYTRGESMRGVLIFHLSLPLANSGVPPACRDRPRVCPPPRPTRTE